MADLEEILGAEGAKILGKDVKGVYRGVNLRRVISYSLTAQEGGLIGCSMDYEHFDENGDTVAKGSNGSSFDPNDHSADAFRTRYHHLIQIDRE